MFKVGDEVVCVDARPANDERSFWLGWRHLKAGKTYVIASICGRWLTLGTQCTTGACKDCTTMQHHYRQWRFVKLPKQTVEYEETVEA